MNTLEKLTASLEKRLELLTSADDSLEAWRMVHKEAPPWRIDRVGEVSVVGWWSDQAPKSKDLEELKEFMSIQGIKKWYLRWRPRKGELQSPPLLCEGDVPVPENWKFLENGLQYQGRKNQGDSFGLFLDQRENRQWVLENANGKRVLNLFAFTCGFSLAAACGGAKEVTSVDLSQPYLDWGKENFLLNSLDPQKFGFRKWDGLEYIKWAQKKNLQFDIIICDPPSFSRNGKKVFRVEKDFVALVQGCLSLLSSEGRLFFSTNYEKWTKSLWQSKLEKEFPGPFSFQNPQVDFSEPSGDGILKSIIFDR